MLGKKIIRGFFCAFLLVIGVMAGNYFSMRSDYRELQRERNYRVTEQVGELREAAGPGSELNSLSLYATSAVLMDADSGRVLYGKDGDAPMAMASTTKIMTCILVLEKGNLEDMVSVSSYAASMPKVKLYVHKGEQYQVRDLLYSLMLESHNDSAVVLAEYIGKVMLSEELRQKDTAEFTAEESKQAVAAFASLMNEKAVELGCRDTWFVTPNGLDATCEIVGQNGECIQKEHHTTARELALIMAYCIRTSPQKDVFLQITRTPNYSFVSGNRSFSCVNHNAFLSMMEGAVSGKTGFTNKAGYCYVGAYAQDGRTYVVSLLACGWPNNKSYKWSDMRELVTYGAENYFYRSLISDSEMSDDEISGNGMQGSEKSGTESYAGIPVERGRSQILGRTAYVAVEKTNVGKGVEGLLMRAEEEVEVSVYQKEKLDAPVQKGMIVGYVCYSVEDTIYRIEDIVTTQNVGRIDRKWCMEQIVRRFLLDK